MKYFLFSLVIVFSGCAGRTPTPPSAGPAPSASPAGGVESEARLAGEIANTEKEISAQEKILRDWRGLQNLAGGSQITESARLRIEELRAKKEELEARRRELRSEQKK